MYTTLGRLADRSQKLTQELDIFRKVEKRVFRFKKESPAGENCTYSWTKWWVNADLSNLNQPTNNNSWIHYVRKDTSTIVGPGRSGELTNIMGELLQWRAWNCVCCWLLGQKAAGRVQAGTGWVLNTACDYIVICLLTLISAQKLSLPTKTSRAFQFSCWPINRTARTVSRLRTLKKSLIRLQNAWALETVGCCP